MITVCNTHDPIIDEETFNIVRNLRHGKRRPTKNGEMVMFSGLVECPTCGRKHQLMKGGKDNRHEWRYVCGSYRKKSRDCTIHSIMLGVLEKVVAEHLRMITEMVAIDENAFAERLMEKSAKSQKSDMAKKKAELDKSKRRVSELDTLYNRIYEDFAFSRLTEERYQRIATAYENEHQTTTTAILEHELTQNAVVGADKFITIVKKYIEVKELTPTLLRELIEKIVVHDKVRTDEPFFDSRGRPRKPIQQQIDIHYNFVGVLG
jgi:transposase-like protein